MVFELRTTEKTPVHFSEWIFKAVFGNLIDGSQSTVWRLVPEGKIPQNYENRSYGAVVNVWNT